MRIDNTPSQLGSRSAGAVAEVHSSPAKKDGSPVSSSASAQQKSLFVQLGSAASAVAQALAQTNDMESARVTEVRRLLEEGRYAIDMDELALSMLPEEMERG